MYPTKVLREAVPYEAQSLSLVAIAKAQDRRVGQMPKEWHFAERRRKGSPPDRRTR